MSLSNDLYLQVGFEFIYEHYSESYGNFLSILGCYAYGLSMDIIIYCFIVLLWKSTLIYKTPKETPADVVWYTNAVIKIVYTVQ